MLVLYFCVRRQELIHVSLDANNFTAFGFWTVDVEPNERRNKVQPDFLTPPETASIPFCQRNDQFITFKDIFC